MSNNWIDVEPGRILHRQVEVRRLSERGYFYNIVWLKGSPKKGDVLDGGWFIAELFGSKLK